MKEDIELKNMKEKAMREMKEFDLKKRISNLETSVNALKAIVDIFAKKSGIEIQRYANGLIIISQ